MNDVLQQKRVTSHSDKKKDGKPHSKSVKSSRKGHVSKSTTKPTSSRTSTSKKISSSNQKPVQTKDKKEDTTNKDKKIEILKSEEKDDEITEQNKVKVIKSVEEYNKLRNKGLVIVDFNTTWCGPCKEFAPVFEQIAEDYPGVTFLSVDAEKIEHKDCASISKLPSFKVLLNGVIKREFPGVDKEKLERYIQRYQVQILINGKVQKSFPTEVREKIAQYMSMLQPIEEEDENDEDDEDNDD